VRAQDVWPSRSVTIISPYPPGGTNDTVARIAAEHLQRTLGQSFIIDNKPGAAGVVGSTMAMRAKPDGYTLLAGNNGALIVQSVVKAPSPYNPATQFQPIVKFVDAGQFIGVSADVPAKTVGELIALAKREPGKLNYSSAGIGSFGHFVGEYFKLLAGVDMVHIPSKGSAAALTELMAGRIQVMIDPLVLTQMSGGRVRVLATVNSERFTSYPQIPTIKESGGPEIDITGWFGLVGPAGIPAEVVRKIEVASRTLMSEPEVARTLVTAGVRPAVIESAAFGQLISSDLKLYADIKTRARMQVE
jgi:tripartite-type tricarboxylate transporter receptor subunit TctC